jgi:hypothetical protein
MNTIVRAPVRKRPWARLGSSYATLDCMYHLPLPPGLLLYIEAPPNDLFQFAADSPGACHSAHYSAPPSMLEYQRPSRPWLGAVPNTGLTNIWIYIHYCMGTPLWSCSSCCGLD